MFLFPISLFLSASLLFIIQPMVAKILLPIYGGTPAIWTVCMLFFQALMLVAYSYAWVLSRFKSVRTWRVTHALVCVLSMFLLPLAFLPTTGEVAPEFTILSNLFFQLGLPLLVIGASAPLLQFAYSQTAVKGASDPYFLYAASNVGSLLALLSYPWLVERFSGVSQQFYGWNIIYVLYLATLMYLLFSVPYQPNRQSITASIKTTWTKRTIWIFYSFIPCSLMLGVTFYISTDVAATPLFWVLPLGLYLLSFVLTFASKPIISHAWVVRNTLIFLVFPILGFIIGASQVQAIQLVIINVIGFFMLALLCHGELVRVRPPVQQLTTFYFCLSLGGVLAGIFNGLLAPRLFSHAYEYPLIFLLALFCIPFNRDNHQSIRSQRKIPFLVFVLLLGNYFLLDTVFGYWLESHRIVEFLALVLIMVGSSSSRTLVLSMAILLMFLFSPWFKTTKVLTQQRNFYGVKQVFSRDGAHVLMSQSTIHGFQVLQDENPTDGARAYYGAIFPVVTLMQEEYQPMHAMVLGLGTGIMACQFRAQDKLTMVEIDQQVIDIAKDPKLFTYLHDCPVPTSLIKADGLLAVKEVPDSSYQLLVMDAFNSDAIPVHLLTLEAFTVYQKKITPDGVILVNISNRHLNVLPVLTGAGRKLDMIVLHTKQGLNERLGQFPSEWALLTTNEQLASQLISQKGWRFVAENDTQLWTNDYSNLIPLLKW